MKLSVIIPTYRRPQDLERCLNALKKQIRKADEVIVVVRDTDELTWQFLEKFDRTSINLLSATVTIPGVIAAMNTGIDRATGDIISITDDDAAPHLDWLVKIENWFLKDDKIAGVGGKDWQPGETSKTELVGRLQWFGRVIGNHHIGTGKAREVDLIKGVNMSWRRSAIGDLRFDERLKGTGAQVHFELAFSLALKRAGWKLIYDPEVAVDHYPAQRFDEDQRQNFNQIAWSNAVHNQTLSLLEHFSPLRRLIFLTWAVLVGTQDAFGLVQWLRFLPRQGSLATQKLLASLQGHWWAILS
ncbi:MAG: glycosyltransferase family 2 protein [Xenococcaceae cyanobacterium]